MNKLSNKKILYVWKAHYPWDIRVDKICTALHKSNAEVSILSRHTQKAPLRENINGINVIRIGNPEQMYMSLPVPKNPMWSKAIKNAVDEIKPDLIIVREIMLAEACGKIGKAHGIPVIMDMAENYPAAMRDWKKYNKSAFSRLLVHTLKIPDVVEKTAVALCNGIIVVCDEQTDRLHKEYNYLKNNIVVVHNTPEQTFVKGNSALKPSNNRTKIFCHHGYLSAEKSIANFLLGFEKAAANHDIQLIVAGSGESEQDYKNMVESFKNKNKILFMGEYDYKSLPDIISKSDIGIVPYQISDFNNYTIHNKIFDYFAFGKPILTSLALPLKRIIEETNAGLAMDFSSGEAAAIAIETILDMDIGLMSRNALKAAHEKYNWSVDAESLVKFISRFV